MSRSIEPMPDGDPQEKKGAIKHRTTIVVAAIAAVAAISIAAIVTLGGHSTTTSASITRPSTPTPPPATTQTTAPPTTTTVAVQPMLIPLSGGAALYEPSTIIYTGDGTGELTGVTWSSWGPSGAIGSGTNSVKGCTPNCASGTPSTFQAIISLSGATQTQYGYIFTEMTIANAKAPVISNSYTLPR